MLFRSNCVIIMTSNIGSHKILAADTITDALKTELDKELMGHFRPEFINRLDATVYFARLSKQQVARIVDLQLQIVIDQLAKQEVTLTVTEAARAQLADAGYQPEFGARPVKRVIAQQVVSRVAEYLLAHPGSKMVTIDWDSQYTVAA